MVLEIQERDGVHNTSIGYRMSKRRGKSSLRLFYLRRTPPKVRPAKDPRFLTTRGRSTRQKRGTTPFSASGRPTRCTRHHSSSNSFSKRRVSPARTPSSSSRVGWNDVDTCMSRVSGLAANTAAELAGGRTGMLLWKDAERGLGTGGKSNESRNGEDGGSG